MAVKKTNKKKEKYITERVNKNGGSFEINIRAYGQTYHKNVRISDFPTRKAALDFACKHRDETLVKMSSGYTVSQFPTVETLYKKTFELFPVRMKTVKRHDVFWNGGISEYGKKTIDQISAADIQTSVNLYARTHTREQVIHFMAVWHRIYKACAMLNVNVIDRTVPVTIPECAEAKPRKKEISASDLETFCDALLEYNKYSESGSYDCRAVWYAIQIMKYCGFRPAETFALTRNDINLIAGQISINKAVHSTYDSLTEIGKTKTAQSVRNVPVPDQLKPILKECLEWSRHEMILADYNGNLMRIDWVCTLILNVRKKCKVDFNLYMLRHQFSSDMFSAGVSPSVIRDLMGHDSANMSLDYAVSNEDDRKTAINERKFS